MRPYPKLPSATGVLTVSDSASAGRYAIFDAIAAGGMASVHLGRLLGSAGFSRTVAIKRLHEQFASDPEFVAMFLDEARLAARVRHPNVVQTLDIVSGEGDLLVVMEYVAGASLSQLLKAAQASLARVPVPVLVDVLVNVLNGLHAAHDATNEQGEPLGIVHRDVSPQNILVGSDGIARVLDFGVAKAAGQSHQTRAGQVKGKLRYMAPEQIRGEAVDRRTDIYAAGVVLWEALTGQRLVSGDNEGAVLFQVLKEGPRLPSQFRDVPLALEEAVMRALRKNPAERFQTAHDMAMALEASAPPVPRSAVAAWVSGLAGQEISQRQARVVAMEGDSSYRLRSDGSSSVSEVRAGQSNRLVARAGSHPVIEAPKAWWSRASVLVVGAGAMAFAAAGALQYVRGTPATAPATAIGGERPLPRPSVASPVPSIPRAEGSASPSAGTPALPQVNGLPLEVARGEAQGTTKAPEASSSRAAAGRTPPRPKGPAKGPTASPQVKISGADRMYRRD